jgi:hypothetical protein
MATYNTGIYKDHGLIRVGMKTSGASTDNAFYVVEFEDESKTRIKSDGGYRFCVTHEGKLTATAGKIAGWQMQDGTLFSKVNEKEGKYTILNSTGPVAFAAGVPWGNDCNDSTGAKFQIYHDGTV